MQIFYNEIGDTEGFYGLSEGYLLILWKHMEI